MFRDWNFVIGLFAVFVMGAMGFTLLVLYPPLLQDVRHYPDATVGYLMSARGLGNFISFSVVVWATRFNARLAFTVGVLLQVWAAWHMTLFDINMSDFDIYWTNFVQGFGYGLAYTPLTVLAFATLPEALVVQGSAVFNLLRNFGSSIFISLSVLVLVRSTAENYAGLSKKIPPEKLQDREDLPPLDPPLHPLPRPASPAGARRTGGRALPDRARRRPQDLGLDP